MGFAFLGGNLALDFVGTLNERTSARLENLVQPSDLGRWLVLAGIVDTAPKADHADLASAIRLREALYEIIRSLIDGTPLPQGALRIVNAAAAQPLPSWRLSADGRLRRTGDVAAGFAAIARDALALFDRSDGAVVKWCSDARCTHPFLDRSRGHRRRWCDMGACGSRAKVAAYRARQA